MNNKITIPNYAVIGNPVNHSRSPQIHHMFSEQTSIKLKYEKIQAFEYDFEQRVKDFFYMGGSGLNITVPFKQKAFMMISPNNISKRAALAKAVNTIWIENNNLYGCNTDGVGLISDLKNLNFDLKNTSILIVGAGGAARGILYPLISSGCSKIKIANRTKTNAEIILKEFSEILEQTDIEISCSSLQEANSDGPWDIVINTTASGLKNEAPNLPSGLFKTNKSLAYDLMYSAKKTPFILHSELDGATRVSDGLGMLVEQAAESFFIWHGIKPDTQLVLTSLKKELSTK
ncbi:shikimate dehydrogenase [Candidatus Kinetoplastibacterium desouzaii TCC079E]|uniref:Shikimate dehydrogenase (NADP(+)) n=1 Tax=Candidatus Kinetoplastidibacterium desouzai TCC079E TaxID=1208919 RepID=M1LV76_9PROT|nr:shikimate dehydrogenase [Candidatus Kinetoplastibacterium desouzaii]AGF47169.1 shikimate dehydrogenase [Candidatus Kinetoplastibacterium desouzaii TCC079E]